MRVGEFICPSLQAFNSCRLGVQDVSVDSCQAPRVVSVHLCYSKNDPSSNGVTICLGRTHQSICPVAALFGYLVRRGNSPDPLFLFRDRSTLSRQWLVWQMQQALAPYGVDCSHLMGHSFRIEVTSAASRAGIEDLWSRHWVAGTCRPISGTSISQAKCWQPLQNNFWTVMITSTLLQIKSHLCFVFIFNWWSNLYFLS